MLHKIDRFSGIEAFIATTKSGSFTAAAKVLELTPSGIAKNISRLEARIGIKLFHRTTRRVTLTAGGEAYLEACRRAIAELEEAESGLAPIDLAPQGRVKISLPGVFGRRHVMPGLLQMALRYEKLDLAIDLGERTVDLIREGFDLAVRIGELDDDANLVGKRLGFQRLIFCASPSYVARYDRVTSPEELKSRACIVGPRRTQKAAWLVQSDGNRPVSVEVGARYEFSDGEAMLQAGLAGCGIMQMPTWLVGGEVEDGRLVTMLDDFAGSEMPINVVWPRSRFMQPKVRAVIEMLSELAAARDSGFLP